MPFIKTQLIATYDTDGFAVGDDGYTFRIEIHKRVSDAVFFAKVFRMEHYRIQPTFPQIGGEPSVEGADEEIFVKDVFFDERELSGASVEACLTKVEQKLIQTFPSASFTQADAPEE